MPQEMNAQNSAEDPQIGQKGMRSCWAEFWSHQIKIQNHLRLQVKGSKTYLGELLCMYVYIVIWFTELQT